MIPLEPLSLVQQPKQITDFPEIGPKVGIFFEKSDFLKNDPKIEKNRFENSDFFHEKKIENLKNITFEIETIFFM